MQFFTILLGLGLPFGTKIGEKSAPELEDLEKRKTLQNIAWASKIQGLARPKRIKKRKKRVGIAARKNDVKKSDNFRFAEPFGLVLGAENVRFSQVWRHFSNLVSRRHGTRPRVGQRRRASELCDCLPGLSND